MIIFLILLTLISFKPYLNSSFPYTHDGENHLARFANYKVAIREGQFPPRFAPNLLNHYGYPVFNYNYPLANILSLPFSFLKVNYELTFKIIVFSFLIAGLIGMNKWLKQFNFDKKSRMFALSTFALTPYLINTLSYRGNIGEIMAFCLFPWLLYFIENPAKTKLRSDLTKFIGQTVALTMFFLSHNIAVLFGSPILLIYALIKYKRRLFKKLSLIISFALATLSSLWFWLPAVLEKNLVILDNADLSKTYTDHFPSLSQLISAPLEFGYSKIGSIDSLSYSIGLVQILVLLICITLLLKKELSKKIKAIFLSVILLILLQLTFTTPLWKLVPLANFIQFPWRLMMFVGIFIVPLAAYVMSNSNKIIKCLLIGFLTFQLVTVLRVRSADYFHKDNITYDVYPASTSTANENIPIKFTFEYFADGNWEPSAQIINGKGTITTQVWRGSKRSYLINLESESTIVEPTMNFAGWETKINDKIIDYDDNEEIRGRIAYTLPAGEYKVQSKFTQKTWPRMVGNILSGFGVLSLILLVTFLKVKDVIKN